MALWFADPAWNAIRTSPEWDAIFRYSVQRLGPYNLLKAENALSSQVEELGWIGTGELGAIAAGALPIITMVGVFVALGAPYFEVRKIVEQEESSSGFSQGFITGLLGWKFGQVASLFGRWGVLRIYQTDEALNVIRVNAYNTSLKGGYIFGTILPDSKQAAILKGLRKAARHPTTGTWTRNDQISFVIALATIVRTRMLRS